MKSILNYIILTLVITSLNAQSPAEHIKEGNEHYRKKEYDKAEISYRKGLEKPSPYTQLAQYNLANSLLKSGNFEGARETYQSLLDTKNNLSPVAQSKIYYNIGNSYLAEKKYQESISPFIEALKRNPYDGDAAYNLSYAIKMLKKQQQQQNNQNKQNKDQNKDKNKDQNKKDDKKDQNQNKDQKEKQDQNKDKKKQGQQPQISKAQAEKLMKAMQNKEKETQRLLHKKDSVKKTNSIGNKDW